jgi:oligopeptide transport system substrate-binding protein
MHYRLFLSSFQRSAVLLLFLFLLALTLAACGGSETPLPAGSTPGPTSKQILKFPNVGTTDIGKLDPSQGLDANSGIVASMVYSGLVKSDKNLNVIPDQATWQVSQNGKVYTFKIKPDITFSDGTPVTAQTYVYTWTRALLPSTASPIASFFAAPIQGADEVASGKSKTLTGVRVVDEHTLEVTLKQPAPYFLSALTNTLFAPLNRNIIEQYGEKNWTQQVAGKGIGTGPLVIKQWEHNVKMIFEPNPRYYGPKTKLQQVEMYFVNDPSTAFKAYRAGQYDFMWNITPTDQAMANGLPGFIRTPLLQTDLLFFDNTKPPFNNVAVRQAIAYATDRNTLVQAVFKGAVTAAPTIIPPGMPGYQPDYPGLAHNPTKAKSLLQSVYPDITKIPPITFSYPGSQVSSLEASALQDMWQKALGIQVKLRSVELNAYNDETSKHLIQFGFTQWGADFPDPYDWLYLNLFSTASNNNGMWKNAEFDRTVQQAEQATGEDRIKLYNKAEQIAINDVGWLPLDHQAMAAIIPRKVQGITLNGNGLFFDDWSRVSIG